ncbi:eukaryotic translation initiation factor 2 subunit 2-like isoform X2 [Corticium candelabrum]|uniref:eukaryotic translation initiation factor 2 subunit 2-like isoform X2 n=1 Tax=Corticium candelabrum TaxID=121492 RepID=UPI002E266131|nr:eukaryotic translation initiation factor 2 subunit 2-like isoform X2 [Corticium candelabrum]
MAENEFDLFDPTKKKKKKKKPTFDVDEQEKNETKPAADVKVEDQDIQPVEVKERVEGELEGLDEDFSMKKKKKKKKPIDMESVGTAIEDVTREKSLKSGEKASNQTDEIEDISLSFGQKKKKKHKKPNLDFDNEQQDDKTKETDDTALPEDGDDHVVDIDDDDMIGDGAPAWVGSDRDYTFQELLDRVFDIMRAKNPDMLASDKKRFVMKPPQVVRIGTKKTSFVNFAEICKLLHRQPKHLLAFLMAELGTSGSVDGNNQLIIKGRFQQKQIENVLRRYIKEYVTCHTCRSPETTLQKETRLFFLQCEKCGSRCSVQSIKSGYQAVTGRRAAVRARQQ